MQRLSHFICRNKTKKNYCDYVIAGRKSMIAGDVSHNENMLVLRCENDKMMKNIFCYKFK